MKPEETPAPVPATVPVAATPPALPPGFNPLVALLPAWPFLTAAALLGAVLAAWASSVFIEGQDAARLAEFLTGQLPWGEFFSWGTLTQGWALIFVPALMLGAASGLVCGAAGWLELADGGSRQRWLSRANAAALALLLLAIPVVVYIPAMTAGFIWDDDQEITANGSIAPIFTSITDPGQFQTNWRGPWEIWTAGLTNDNDNDDVRVANGKKPAPWLVSLLREPLRGIEKELYYRPTDPKNPYKRPDGSYAFTANQGADYLPLKTTFLWVEYQLWGYNLAPDGRPVPSGTPFHVMNILTHALDALLLWLILRQLRLRGAWLGALLFAVHPVHAESVAWIAERKNTLSLFFALLSVSAWLKYKAHAVAEQVADAARLFTKRRVWYAAALLLFVAALLCKSHVVVLPAVLMLLDWWNTGKLPNERGLTKIAPFFVVAFVITIITIWFQGDRAVGTEVIPIGGAASRLAGAGIVTWLYAVKAVVPMFLNTIYADNAFLWWPLADPRWWQFGAGLLVLAALGGTLWLALRKGPHGTRADRTPFFILAFFVGTLFPTLGFFQMSYMRLTLQADHFQYFSDIAYVAFLGAGAAWLYQRFSGWRERAALLGGIALVLVIFCGYSWDRAGVHQGEKTLWTACLKLNDNSWQAHNHMGAVVYAEYNELANAGRKAEAEEKMKLATYHFGRAVGLKPENPEVHNNLGLTHWYYGRRDEAIAEYRRAVEIKGDVMQLRRNLADALLQRGQPPDGQPVTEAHQRDLRDAIAEYLLILKENPLNPDLRTNFAIALIRSGRIAEGKAELELALRLAPGHRVANDVYRQLMEQLGRLQQQQPAGNPAVK